MRRGKRPEKVVISLSETTAELVFHWTAHGMKLDVYMDSKVTLLTMLCACSVWMVCSVTLHRREMGISHVLFLCKVRRSVGILEERGN